eukprot:403354382
MEPKNLKQGDQSQTDLPKIFDSTQQQIIEQKYLTIESVLEEAKGKGDVVLLKDHQIFYLVLNRGDNSFNPPFIQLIHDKLDEVEQSQGPACLVSIGANEKLFSSGLDVKYKKATQNYGFELPYQMQHLLNRILLLPIPTLSVINGSALAGGLMYALAHDFRIMKSEKSYISLSELTYNVTIPPAFAALIKYQLQPQTVRLMIYGGKYKGSQALKLKVVEKLYKDNQQLMNYVQLFRKEFAQFGSENRREALMENKKNIHAQISKVVEKVPGVTLGRFSNGVKL